MRKNCDKCNFSYDTRLEKCPKCGSTNSEFEKTNIKNPLYFLDITRSLIIFAIYFLGNYIIASVIGLIVGATNKSLINEPIFLVSTQLAITASMLIGIIAVIWNYKSIIFKSYTKWQNLVFGLIIGGVIFGLSYALGLVLPNESSNQQTIVTLVDTYPVLTAITVVLLGPITEEFIFRVSLMSLSSKFTKKYIRLISYIISCTVFVLIHINFLGENVNIINELKAIPSYLIGALGLAFAYDYFGFAGSTIAHITNNLIAFIVLICQ